MILVRYNFRVKLQGRVGMYDYRCYSGKEQKQVEKGYWVGQGGSGGGDSNFRQNFVLVVKIELCRSF